MQDAGHNSNAYQLERIGIIRIESHYLHDNVIRGGSSFPLWLSALTRHVAELHLLLPIVAPSSNHPLDTESMGGYRLRDTDRLYRVGSCVGYLRGFTRLPRILVQLIRMRRRIRVVIVRVPEHVHMLLLPLLRLLGFQLVVWLVHDRNMTFAAERKRRRTARASFGLMLNRMTGWVEKQFIRSSIVLANGSELFEFARSLNQDAGRVRKVISTNLNCDVLAASQSLSGESRLERELLYVGRIAVDKGLSDLIAALELGAEQGCRDLRLSVVGPAVAGELARLKAQVHAAGLDDRVRFRGAVPFGPHLFELFRSASIFVLPSWAEGTPRVLVEAMAFGMPVIATRVGGVPDIVEDGRNGRLVAPHSPEELAAAINALIADPPRQQRFSDESRKIAAHLTVENFAENLVKFLADQPVFSKS